ncbi:aconitase iron-sulfur domain-containing protein [Lophiostoma macrostomum CBS 122681]|uniref:Aconitase iron-sulfur domain-containing protein n=1 Tax=Lophiostoma macrostomum CBS 122681 TaxID=1314788 RepID=A0A6A6SKH8_9PLEO|nr:aconitase iron-sulfur domain-containing protein [Lophiostoma macrostomum CBS 122681]
MVHTKTFNIAVLPGDGAGPALAAHARRVLDAIQQTRGRHAFVLSELPFGAFALDAGASSALPVDTLSSCKAADAVLLCGCGGLAHHGTQPEQALLRLRSELGTNANIRPVSFPSIQLVAASAYKPDVVADLDITFVRDLTGGVYYGRRQEADQHGLAYDTTEYSRHRIQSLAQWAGRHAMHFTPPKTVHSVDKANVMATSRLWRSTVTDLFADEFPQVPLQHVLVDAASETLSREPTALNGIILTENMFGDILSDQASGIIGDPNVVASSAIPTDGRAGIFEPLSLKAGGNPAQSPIAIIQAISLMLSLGLGLRAEADAIDNALRRTLDPPELVGANVQLKTLGACTTTDDFMRTFLDKLSYFLEAANSVDELYQPSSPPAKCISNPTKTRPMGIVEKIITNAALGLTTPEVTPGQIVCVKVDWTITSELLWAGMEKTYDRMKRPRLYRNDRVWLAIDHIVDPRTNHLPKQKGLISKAEHFQQEAKIIDFLPANTSIMHTDFTRERAQPGHIVVGSDSHTCSAGSMGALAVGFGAADVVMPMVTGETWLRVPEVCRINFVGKLPYGTSGKDVILHILGLFKRNTIAFQRAVEYAGDGLCELSMDARFAIANMTTEFGGMGACFEADERTTEWISRRTLPQHKDRGLYFQSDAGAQYAEERTIDLSDVRVTVALFPNPDDVVSVRDCLGMQLDGCFVGACTTTEEDIILGGLVLEAGLSAGLTPTNNGKRRVTPGSLTIVKRLEERGILDAYRQAGFQVGAPGCSYCIGEPLFLSGMVATNSPGINDVDVAGEGEVWLSSQNRNFRNRMGKGSFGNITSASAVAASSFTMEVTDPSFLLSRIDPKRYEKFLGREMVTLKLAPTVSEPRAENSQLQKPILANVSSVNTVASGTNRKVRSKVQRFGDNVDTDAIIPAEFMPGIDNADLGSHCFEYYRPEFRQRAKDGATIV